MSWSVTVYIYIYIYICIVINVYPAQVLFEKSNYIDWIFIYIYVVYMLLFYTNKYVITPKQK
jgi:hypothetical protein